MSLEKNKAIVCKYIESYNSRNLDFDDLFAPDYFDHTHQQKGLEGMKQLMNMAFKAFPDWYETIEEINAEGDKVWVRLTYTATHIGEYLGIAPTGKKITLKAVAIYRIANEKIVEGRFVTDQLNFLKQLGVIEITEKGKIFFQEDVK
ncbi:MAG: ester cyclase [Candidatus Hermodarchaeota archaeon]